MIYFNTKEACAALGVRYADITLITKKRTSYQEPIYKAKHVINGRTVFSYSDMVTLGIIHAAKKYMGVQNLGACRQLSLICVLLEDFLSKYLIDLGFNPFSVKFGKVLNCAELNARLTIYRTRFQQNEYDSFFKYTQKIKAIFTIEGDSHGLRAFCYFDSMSKSGRVNDGNIIRNIKKFSTDTEKEYQEYYEYGQTFMISDIARDILKAMGITP